MTEKEKLQDVTINYLINLGMEDSWGFHNTYTLESQHNFIDFANNEYYSLDNPNLIYNLNKSLIGISPQRLIDMVDYFYNLAYLFADNSYAKKYHLIDTKYWESIKFVPKRGKKIARYNGSIVNDNVVSFLIDDGMHTTKVNVDTISKTYEFIGIYR